MSIYSRRVSALAQLPLKQHVEVRIQPSDVPDIQDISLEKHEGVEMDAAFLYADLVDSTTLAQRAYKPVAAKILRSYINGASDILVHYGGVIRSFDGDRIMATFMGPNKETVAVRAALAINWLVQDALRPKISESYEGIDDWWTMKHSIGIATGVALLTRMEACSDNDLVPVGSAPSVAAKLSQERDGFPLHITQAVFDAIDKSVSYTDPDRYREPFWAPAPARNFGGETVRMQRSRGWWEPE